MSLEKARALADEAVRSVPTAGQMPNRTSYRLFMESWAEYLREQHEHYDAHAKLTEIGELIKDMEADDHNHLVRAIEDVLDREG